RRPRAGGDRSRSSRDVLPERQPHGDRECGPGVGQHGVIDAWTQSDGPEWLRKRHRTPETPAESGRESWHRGRAAGEHHGVNPGGRLGRGEVERTVNPAREGRRIAREAIHRNVTREDRSVTPGDDDVGPSRTDVYQR